MTLSSETSRVAYAGDGSTTAFTVTFPFFDNDHVKAVLRSSAGAETVWVEDTDYTLTGGDGSTGTLTAGTAPASGETLVILRDIPFTQETDYPEGGAFPAQSHENALDLARMVDQQLQEQIDRTMKFPVTDADAATADLPSLSARKGKLLGFDATTGAPEAAEPTGQVEVKTDATRGAAGTAGRIIFNSDDGTINIDDGTNWVLPDGTVT